MSSPRSKIDFVRFYFVCSVFYFSTQPCPAPNNLASKWQVPSSWRPWWLACRKRSSTAGAAPRIKVWWSPSWPPSARRDGAIPFGSMWKDERLQQFASDVIACHSCEWKRKDVDSFLNRYHSMTELWWTFMTVIHTNPVLGETYFTCGLGLCQRPKQA